MRCCLVNQTEVKFLLRYEVENESEVMGSRYRLARIMLTLDSLFAFQLKASVSVSSKLANEHIANIQLSEKVNKSSLYQTPIIRSVQILNPENLWTLSKKDENGKFIRIMHNESDPVNILAFDGSEGHDILSDPTKNQFLEYETDFVLNKVKLKPTIPTEEIDAIVEWVMPTLGKEGFYVLFKTRMFKFQQELTTA